MNRRWIEYTGLSPGTHDLSFFDVVHPDDRVGIERRWTEAVRNESDFQAEVRLRAHDDTYRWFELRVGPVRDRSAKTSCWYGIGFDINEQYEVHLALNLERDRLRRIAETCPSVIHSLRIYPDGRSYFDFVSEAIRDVYGLDPAQLLIDAQPILDAVHPDDRPAIEASVRRSAAAMLPWRNEFRVRHAQGGLRWVEVHSVPVQDTDGALVWHGVLTDVSDRRHVIEELRTSRAQLVSALQAGAMVTWTWDLEKDRFDWETPSAGEGTTTDRRVLVGPALFDSLHPDDRERVRAELTAALAERRGLHTEFRYSKPGQAERWFTCRGRLAFDAAGKPRRMTGIAMDITARRREEELHARTDKLEALGTLAGGIAHDFNNVLLAIQANLEMATGELPRSHPAHPPLGEIRQAITRASDLVRRILTFSRPGEKRRELVDLAALIQESVRLLRPSCPPNVELVVFIGPELSPVWGDASQLHQVIVNLVNNALAAVRPRGGRVEVSADNASPTVVALNVRDDGCGMDRATLERIFDPFFSTKRDGQGTGLGLSVVHGIVRAHGGTIRVESSVGQGSLFAIQLSSSASADERVSTDAGSDI